MCAYPVDKAVGDQLTADDMNDYIFGPEVTYGETIAAAKALYLKASDGKVWKADADVVANVDSFVGFSKDAGVADDAKHIVGPGRVATGFSGLTAGSKYYLSNTAGDISTTAGTRPVVVGVALSTTTLLVLSPSVFAAPSASLTPANLNALVDGAAIALHFHQFAFGTSSFSASATNTITPGFQARLVVIFAATTDASYPRRSEGASDGSSNKCIYFSDGDTSSVDTSNAWHAAGSGSVKHEGVVNNITATQFDLVNTKTGSPSNVNIFWIALG